MRLRLWQKTYAVAALPLFLGFCFFVSLWLLISDVQSAARREEIARTQLAANQQLINSVIAVATALYTYSRTLEDGDLARFKAERAQLDEFRRNFNVDMPEKDDTDKQLDAALSYCDQMVQLLPKHRQPIVQLKIGQLSAEFAPKLYEVRELNDRVKQRILKEVHQAEAGLDSRSSFVRLFVLIGMLVMVASTVGAAFVLQRSVISRLGALANSAASLMKLEKPQVNITGGDEIADLQAAYQSMSEQILEARAHERAIINHASDVLFSADRDGMISQISPSCEIVWGRSPDSLINTRLEGIEWRDGTIETVLFERPMRISVQWSHESGQWNCVAHDASHLVARENELREREARIKAFVEKMPAGLLVLDENYSPIRANEKAVQLLALNTTEPVKDLFGISAADEFSGRVIQRSLRLSDDDTRWVELTMHSYAEDGAQRYLLTFIDITERYQVKLMRDRLVAMIAHDIGTPLSSIQAVLKMLSIGTYGQLGEGGVKQVQAAEEDTKKLMKTFKELLAIERRLQVDS